MIPEDFWLRASVMISDEALVHDAFRFLKSYEASNWTQFWKTLAYSATTSKSEIERQRYICGCLAIACYPCIDNQEKQLTYEKLKTHYEHLCALEGYPLITNKIQFEESLVPYTLRRCSNPKATILTIRGLDSSKEVRYWDETILLKAGFNIVSIDLPGMAENQMHMTSHSDSLFLALLNHLRQEEDLSTFIAWGLGFGGYWATRLMISSSLVIGCINQGGPIYYGFKPSLKKLVFNFSEVRFLGQMIQRAIGGKQSTRKFVASLPIKQKTIQKGIKQPYLYINGYKDKTASHKDGDFLKENIPHNIFSAIRIEDGGHLAIDRLDDMVIPGILSWLEHLAIPAMPEPKLA